MWQIMLYLIEREYYFSKMRRTKQNQDFVVYLKYIKWAARLFVRPDKHFTKLHWGFHEVPSGNCAILQVYLSTWQVIFICFIVEQCSSESVLNNPEGIEKGRTVLLKLFFSQYFWSNQSQQCSLYSHWRLWEFL